MYLERRAGKSVAVPASRVGCEVGPSGGVSVAVRVFGARWSRRSLGRVEPAVVPGVAAPSRVVFFWWGVALVFGVTVEV